MKKTLLVFTSIVALAACSSWTPLHRQQAYNVAAVTTSVFGKAAAFTAQLVINSATSAEDLSNKHDLLDSAALGLRSVEQFGVTGDIVKNAILLATDAGKQHWINLANKAAAEIEAKPAAERPIAAEAIAQAFNAARGE